MIIKIRKYFKYSSVHQFFKCIQYEPFYLYLWCNTKTYKMLVINMNITEEVMEVKNYKSNDRKGGDYHHNGGSNIVTFGVVDINNTYIL